MSLQPKKRSVMILLTKGPSVPKQPGIQANRGVRRNLPGTHGQDQGHAPVLYRQPLVVFDGGGKVDGQEGEGGKVGGWEVKKERRKIITSYPLNCGIFPPSEILAVQACKTEQTEQEKEKLINDSLPFIKYTAYRLSRRLPPQLSVEDLISVGVAGLLEALQRFTEGRVKFTTFAEYRIRGAMLDELRAHDWVPRSLKDKVTLIKRAHMKLEQELGRSPEEEEIAESLDMPLDEYRRTLQDSSNAVVFSFGDFNGNFNEDGDIDVTESIADPEAKSPLQLYEDKDTRDLLASQIATLPQKEKLVLSLYYWDELTMKEIGKVLGVTEGRVCQLHNQALIRLKAQLNARFGH